MRFKKLNKTRTSSTNHFETLLHNLILLVDRLVNHKKKFKCIFHFNLEFGVNYYSKFSSNVRRFIYTIIATIFSKYCLQRAYVRLFKNYGLFRKNIFKKVTKIRF